MPDDVPLEGGLVADATGTGESAAVEPTHSDGAPSCPTEFRPQQYSSSSFVIPQA